MFKNLIPLLFLPLLWIACTDDNMPYDIGKDEVDVRTRIGMIDTFTVKSYTVMLDSIPTSGMQYPSTGIQNPAIVVGNLNDEELGTINAGSFFRVNLPSKVSSSGNNTYQIDNDAVFDSIKLYIIYNKFYQGDTTLPFSINLHRLKDVLKPNSSGFFYNNDSIAAFAELLGSSTFYPSPNSGDTVWITIDRALGEYIFEQMKENENVLVENDLFQHFFKGFMLRGDGTNNALIGFGFPGGSTGTIYPGMRIFYHYFEYSTINRKFDFLAQATEELDARIIRLQFNRFVLSNPKVTFPALQKNKLPVSFTNNRSYVLAGLGIVTRIEIPYLKNLFYIDENIRILDAKIELEPISGTYSEETLPREISLHSTDNSNIWGELQYNKSGTSSIADLNIDMLYQEDTKYTFDITGFAISSLLSQTNVIPALMLHISQEDQLTTNLITNQSLN
jgi:hypothetical protein